MKSSTGIKQTRLYSVHEIVVHSMLLSNLTRQTGRSGITFALAVCRSEVFDAKLQTTAALKLCDLGRQDSLTTLSSQVAQVRVSTATPTLKLHDLPPLIVVAEWFPSTTRDEATRGWIYA